MQAAREGLAARGRAVTADWTGRAAPAALELVERQALELERAVDAVARSAPPLAVYAEALRDAQRDFALGEQMVREGEAARLATGSGATAVADAARDGAAQTIADGASAMQSAQERALEANEVAARALAEAAWALAGLVPASAPAPVVGRDGTFGDGLVKAVGDVSGEIVNSVSGLTTLLNPFSDAFGPAWASTWETVRATVTDPVGAGRAVVEGTVAPIGESYGTGGLDEAIGRTPAVLAGVIGTKGLTKLNKLRRLRGENQTPLAPGGGLQHHEEAGGHTLAPHKVHIGTDEQALFDRVQNAPRPIPSASSFFDRAIAERSVAENLAGNRGAIDDWLANTSARNQVVDFEHRQAVGISIDRSATSPADAVEVHRTRLVLRRDATQPDGFYVLTSYPQR
ncbi:RNase A-like domain-containing protein [Actinomycetospora sp. OC33-EN08]|uniref:RNase A-like domain-containing protein n=1 Tax=Actinomycetospora aurantiaca TaxID=3129233 RepID=A0ABU8MIG3_9PSEU